MRPINAASAIRASVMRAGLLAHGIGDFLGFPRKQAWTGDFSKAQNDGCGDEMLVVVPAADARSIWNPGSAPTQRIASPFADLDMKHVAN